VHLPEQQSLFATQATASSPHVATEVMHVLFAQEPLQHSRLLVQALPEDLQTSKRPFTHLPASHLPEQHSWLFVHAFVSALQTPAGWTQMPPPQLPEQHCQSALHAFVVVVQLPAAGTQSSLLHDPEQQSESATHAVLNRCFTQATGAGSSAASGPASGAGGGRGGGVSLFGVVG